MKRQRAPRTADEFYGMSKRRRTQAIRSAQVASEVRRGVSFSQALKNNHIGRQTALRRGGSVFRKLPNGRYTAKSSDRLLRVLIVLTPEGKQEVVLRDSREASKVGKHWNAVQKYVETGDASALEQFAGVQVTDVQGNKIALLTDTDTLDLYADAGVLSFESIYAGAA